MRITLAIGLILLFTSAALAERRLYLLWYDDAKPGVYVLEVDDSGSVKNLQVSGQISLNAPTTPDEPDEPDNPTPSTFKKQIQDITSQVNLSAERKKQAATFFRSVSGLDFTTAKEMIDSTWQLWTFIAQPDEGLKKWGSDVKAVVQSEDFSSVSEAASAFRTIADVLEGK